MNTKPKEQTIKERVDDLEKYSHSTMKVVAERIALIWVKISNLEKMIHDKK